MSYNGHIKLSKMAIVKISIFVVLIFLMIFWNVQTGRQLDKLWKDNNNINPIRCPISNIVDSVGQEGRHVFLKLDNKSRFYFRSEQIPVNIRRKNLLKTINAGDSVIKISHSDTLIVKKQHTNEVIKLRLYGKEYGINYGKLPCVPEKEVK